MIKAIHIQNFQSHKDSTLEFSDKVNVIVGPSDSGKTAILRAIYWLVRNRPLGDEFRSKWGGDTIISLRLLPEPDYGIISIHRARTDKENTYGLETEICGVTDVFQAIKSDVPEEIQKVLNINEISLQRQLDQPFLLAESPGEVGTHFNRIAHLDAIDIGTQNVQKWLRSIEQDIRSGEQYLKEQREELKKYEHLDMMEQQVQVLETLDKQQTVLIRQTSKLKRLIFDIGQVQNEISKYNTILSFQPQVETALELYRKKKERQKQYDGLSELLSVIKATEQTNVKKKEQLKLLEKRFHDEFPDICPLCRQRVKK